MSLHRLVPSTARFDSSVLFTRTSAVVTSEVFPPGPSPIPGLGSRLFALFGESYSGGTWTSDVGGHVLDDDGTGTTTTTTPAGRTVLSFSTSGTADYVVGALGVGSYAGAALVACVFRTSGVTTETFLLGGITGAPEIISSLTITSTGQVKAYYAGSVATTTGSYADGAWHYAMLAGAYATDDVDLYIDGTLAASGSGGAGFPYLATLVVAAGMDLSLATGSLDGEVGCAILAVDPSSDWTSGDIDEVNDYLQAWISTTTEVSPIATGAGWSAAAATLQALVSPGACTATWSIPAATAVALVSATPASATWAAVDAGNSVSVSASPSAATAVWSAASPTLALDLSADVAAATWQASAATPEAGVYVSAAAATWAAEDATTTVSVSVSPAAAAVMWFAFDAIEPSSGVGGIRQLALAIKVGL